MHLAELNVYPLKGARGIALDRAEVLRGGLRHDRRFMLLDAKGTFVTQRSHPTLALVVTELTDSELVLRTPKGDAARTPLRPDGERRAVRVWNDDVEAAVVLGPAAALLSEHLGETCSLVFMPDETVRPVEVPYGAPGDRVGFADAYPVLLATRASLAELNSRLSVAVPMNRFRPNFVLEGGDAWEEELHGSVRVGGLVFRMPKRCARCSVTVIDQATAQVGKEPLRTLASYRRENTLSGVTKRDNKVYFAQNLIPNAEGSVAVGDEAVYLGRLAT
jgi:uncharacterized protein YcbX